MKFLIVEDDCFFAQHIRELLSDNGIDSCVATNVEGALKCSEKFDGLISDVRLPNDPSKSGISDAESRGGFASGIALYRALRKRGFAGPTILLSASSQASDAAIWAKDQHVPFVAKDEGQSALLATLRKIGVLPKNGGLRAFIVHGHDDHAVDQLKDYLQNTLKWSEPVILREQASSGKTIIEKFEHYAGSIDCVFVVMTPDDPGINPATADDKRRARQNVIFELGFFYAQMGRHSGRVVVLCKGKLDLPSDIQGIVWIDISNGVKAAGEEIRREVAHITN
jgi:CheY-like chemotaxis protein